MRYFENRKGGENLKILNFIKHFFLTVTTVMLCLIVYGYYFVPDVITTFPNEKILLSGIYTVDFENEAINTEAAKTVTVEGDYKTNVKLFNKIPIKTNSTVVSSRKYVVPSGEIIGLRMFTHGVLIISTDSVKTSFSTENPSEKAGIKSGDVIVSMCNNEVNSVDDVLKAITQSEGRTLSVVYVRNEKQYTTEITPVLSSSDGKYKVGWWIKDSAAGIGTMTFYEKSTGIFASLGHGICDSDTSLLLSLYYGDIVEAEISGCSKGKEGSAGELCGTFSSGKIGSIYENGNSGVYGVLDSINKEAKEIPVALATEVQTGEATILSTVDATGVKEYKIKIEKVDLNNNSSRNLVIKITDSNLLEKTGGIVQGMSGSPIIQNGMLIGAVTHVLINDPSKGYGIFAENMLKTAYSSFKE